MHTRTGIPIHIEIDLDVGLILYGIILYLVVYAFLKAGVEMTADSDGMELALGRWQLLWRALPLVPEPVRV